VYLDLSVRVLHLRHVQRWKGRVERWIHRLNPTRLVHIRGVVVRHILVETHVDQLLAALKRIPRRMLQHHVPVSVNLRETLLIRLVKRVIHPRHQVALTRHADVAETGGSHCNTCGREARPVQFSHCVTVKLKPERFSTI